MMKTRVILILTALCLLVAALPVSATVLTGGVASVAEESGMIKGAVAGSTVRFSATDFKQAMGITRFEGITVTAVDGINGYAFSKAEVAAAAEALGYGEGEYEVMFVFVPDGADGNFDYAVIFD